MSLGFGANAYLVAFDSDTVIYQYGSYNLNDPKFYNDNHVCDGIITISRSCFKESEIHEKLKKMPSGRKKLIIKRIPVYVEYDEMIDNGQITIENCSNRWEYAYGSNIDVMACHILFYLFQQYQIEGKLPDHISYNV